ncbi:MAG: putative rRNA maturation factor [Candidatus Omnitrophota bacterium]|jgi:probable rRNA maturation factor
MSVKIDILNEQNSLRVNSKRIEKLIQSVLKGEKAKQRSVTLLVCGDAKMKVLNKQYFGKKTSTDVIAFGVEADYIAPGEEDYLGDIVVSADMAISTAPKYKTQPQREFERYIVHGLLHLLGYNDVEPADYKKMHSVQEVYLDRFITASSKGLS